MKNKIVVRAVIGLFAIAVLFLAYEWFKGFTMDPDTGRTDTTDMIAALEYTDDGDTLVLFDSGGDKTVVPGHERDTNDLDPVWRPDGQRVFFTSTRGGLSSAIYRWNVATNKVEKKSDGSRGASSPYFGPPDWPNVADSGLITLGGNVFDFNQRDKGLKQVLPPTDFARAGDPGQAEAIQTAYERIGSSFKSAKWGKNREVIYAVMQGESHDVFIVNYMDGIGEMSSGPAPLFAAHSIQFDVAADGTAVVSVQGFEYPDLENIPKEFVRDGIALKPYRNALVAISIREDGQPDFVYMYTDQPDLGLFPSLLTAELRQQSGIPASVNGVYVQEIAPAAVAERVGIQKGDVIVSINATQLTSVESMYMSLSQVMFGGEATIVYYSTKTGAVGLKTVAHRFADGVTMALKDPAISPDSEWVAVTAGQVNGYEYSPRELMLIQIEVGGIQRRKRLIEGVISEPSWHPSGEKLVYSKLSPSNEGQIFVIGADGSNEKRVSGVGDFGSPKFSPYQKGS